MLKEEEIVENNTLLGRFLEVQFYITTDNKISFRPDKYWEHLMPIVEKIEKLQTDVIITRTSCRIKTWFKGFDQECLSEESKIHAVYYIAVKYIKWYNNEKCAE